MTPTPAQARYLDTNARYNLWLGGRGSGGSVALCLAAVQSADENPGCPGLLCGRTYAETHNVLAPYLWPLIDGRVKGYNRELRVITLDNGSSILLRSWDGPALLRLRAYSIAWACVDQLGHGNADPWYAVCMVAASLRHPGAKEPRLWAASAPSDRLPLDGISSEWRVTKVPTADNPHLGAGTIEALRGSMSPRMVRRELDLVES